MNSPAFSQNCTGKWNVTHNPLADFRFESSEHLARRGFVPHEENRMLSPSVLSSSPQPARLFTRRTPGLAACLGVTSLAVASLLALSGCAAVQVRMGRKAYIDKIPMASMTASLPKGPGIAPGEKSPLEATFTAPDGTVWKTEGEGHGKILWKDLTVTASLVTAN